MPQKAANGGAKMSLERGDGWFILLRCGKTHVRAAAFFHLFKFFFVFIFLPLHQKKADCGGLQNVMKIQMVLVKTGSVDTIFSLILGTEYGRMAWGYRAFEVPVTCFYL
jgi:hypothetical protein